MEITGVLEVTSMTTPWVVETPARLVPVKCTMYRPVWVAWGYQENVPLLGLKPAFGGRPAIDNATESPAGSLAETVKVTAFPGRTTCSPGTVSTGA